MAFCTFEVTQPSENMSLNIYQTLHSNSSSTLPGVLINLFSNVSIHQYTLILTVQYNTVSRRHRKNTNLSLSYANDSSV